jgi:hypothetical protein
MRAVASANNKTQRAWMIGEDGYKPEVGTSFALYPNGADSELHRPSVLSRQSRASDITFPFRIPGTYGFIVMEGL